MLIEAHRLKADGVDVVIGLVETHNRLETMKLVEGLEVVPRRRVEYHGISIEEMDVDAILARKPQVVLVDELAHTNVPDSRNPKRYQDVQGILAAGIHVISALNVQHLESLYNTVEKVLGVKVRERLPDSVLAEADVVVNVDLAAEDLQRRLKEGKIYPEDRAVSALQNFFTPTNLEHLRELTMRELASQLDIKRREVNTEPVVSNGTSDQVMVCLSSRGPNSTQLLRYGSRVAGRLNRNWYAVYVQTPSEEPTSIDARTQRLLSDTLTLANQLGATVFTFKGTDVPDTILRFAREYRVGNIIIGRPRPISWLGWMKGARSVAEQLIRKAAGMTVIVVDVENELPGSVEMRSESSPFPTSKTSSSIGGLNGSIARMLTPDRILIWEDPPTKEELFRKLARAVGGENSLRVEEIVQKIQEREQTGSTFLNEGISLPHARMDSLSQPAVALGLTQNGVLDSPTEKPIEAVFVLLSPSSESGTHLQLLAKAARLLQSRELRRRLSKISKPAEVLEEISNWERSGGSVG